MLIAHRIALDPNNVQATYLTRAAGVARFAYNWALFEWRRQYVAHQADPTLPTPSQLALRRQLNAIKRERPWPRAQAWDETGPGEAGTQRQS
jgi:putative transposase